MDKIIYRLYADFKLDFLGIHGFPHWQRVLKNGMAIASQNGADEEIVKLFAVLHDSGRQDEWEDPDHGERGVEYAKKLRAEGLFELSDEQFEVLSYAILHHSEGMTKHDNVTVLTCWDADRLDLGRVGIKPSREYLCTEVAKKMI